MAVPKTTTKEYPDPKTPDEQEIHRARHWMAQRWPELFSGRGGVPLAVGAGKLIKEAAKTEENGPPEWAIQEALCRWTRHPRYLEAMVSGKSRYHLDGTEAGPVSPAHRKEALKVLQERRRRQQGTRKAAHVERTNSENAGSKGALTRPKGGKAGKEPSPGKVASKATASSRTTDVGSSKTTPKKPRWEKTLTLNKSKKNMVEQEARNS